MRALIIPIGSLYCLGISIKQSSLNLRSTRKHNVSTFCTTVWQKMQTVHKIGQSSLHFHLVVTFSLIVVAVMSRSVAQYSKAIGMVLATKSLIFTSWQSRSINQYLDHLSFES